MLDLLAQSPIAFIIFLTGLLLSITIHEFSHCFVTDRLGDPTPRMKGRLTLNPLAHLDPLGALALILTGFGWGKAAPYDPYNLKEPIRDTALIAAAGPASNLLIATVLSLLLKFGIGGDFVALFTVQLIYINVTLALFNLIPIYPLDGGKIMRALLPYQASLEYEDIMERYGTAILIMMIFPWVGGESAVQGLLTPAINLVLRIFI
ncbi:MAG TPA: site-2 protease family protein [Candidatus Woesebacteria bacterium]|nr:site-2 protease family protein [Candidatus Woesebacteria bacterium]